MLFLISLLVLTKFQPPPFVQMRAPVRALCVAASALLLCSSLASAAETETFVIPSTFPATIPAGAPAPSFRAVMGPDFVFDPAAAYRLSFCDSAVPAADTTVTAAYVHASLEQFAFSGENNNCTAKLAAAGSTTPVELGAVAFTNEFPDTVVTQFLPTFYNARAATAATIFVVSGTGLDVVKKVVVHTVAPELSSLLRYATSYVYNDDGSVSPASSPEFALGEGDDVSAECTKLIATATTVACTLPSFPATAQVPRVLTVTYLDAANAPVAEHTIEATPADVPVNYAPSAVAPAVLPTGVTTKLTVTFPKPVPATYPWSAVFVNSATMLPVIGATVSPLIFAADRLSATVEVTVPADATVTGKYALSLGQAALVSAPTAYSYINERDEEVFVVDGADSAKAAKQSLFNTAVVAPSSFELTVSQSVVTIGAVFPGAVHVNTLSLDGTHLRIDLASGTFPAGGAVTVNGKYAAVVSASPLMVTLKGVKLEAGPVTVALKDSLKDDAKTVAELAEAFTVYGAAADKVYLAHEYAIAPLAVAVGATTNVIFTMTNPEKKAVTVDVDATTGIVPDTKHSAGSTYVTVPFKNTGKEMFKSVNVKFHVGDTVLPAVMQYVPQPVPKSVTPAKIDIKVRPQQRFYDVSVIRSIIYIYLFFCYHNSHFSCFLFCFVHTIVQDRDQGDRGPRRRLHWHAAARDHALRRQRQGHRLGLRRQDPRRDRERRLHHLHHRLQGPHRDLCLLSRRPRHVHDRGGGQHQVRRRRRLERVVLGARYRAHCRAGRRRLLWLQGLQAPPGPQHHARAVAQRGLALPHALSAKQKDTDLRFVLRRAATV